MMLSSELLRLLSSSGIYDTDYLDYIRSLLSLLPRYGIVAFVVLHQDVWSRYSGGSGAPAWTLEAVGFDLHQLEATGAAWLKGVTGGGHVESERGLWPCGYHKMAAATMAYVHFAFVSQAFVHRSFRTCFWAGDAFASKLKVETSSGSVTIQAYLQDAFLNMYEMVVKAVGDLEGVIGFEVCIASIRIHICNNHVADDERAASRLYQSLIIAFFQLQHRSSSVLYSSVLLAITKITRDSSYIV